ncbi:MAG: hypothetical protein Q4F49_02855 [Pseudoxanthomonas suwonensis]|nr:hypothetical protein [Pseudoxanthomonas suwonensis]
MISIFWGIAALLWTLLALVPLLGWMNWLMIPFAVIGAIIAAIGMASSGPHRRGRATTGLLLNVAAIIVGSMRLGIGGGLI